MSHIGIGFIHNIARGRANMKELYKKLILNNGDEEERRCEGGGVGLYSHMKAYYQ